MTGEVNKTVADTCSSSVTAVNSHADGSEKRLFDMLDKDGQERVVVMKTRYAALGPLQQKALLQELGLFSVANVNEGESALVEQCKLSRYSSPRVTAVQGRDPGYIYLPYAPHKIEQDIMKSNIQPSTLSEGQLRKLFPSGLFGDGKVNVHVQRKSIYEKIDMDGIASANSATEKVQQGDSKKQQQADEAKALLQRIDQPVRSNAYQAVRLSHNFPHHINIDNKGKTTNTNASDDGSEITDDGEASCVLNVTGMPLYDHELRECFNHLDKAGSGSISCTDFNEFMRSLKRDFGVAQEYAILESQAENFSTDGKLSFEAFAYLIMRFARA